MVCDIDCNYSANEYEGFLSLMWLARTLGLQWLNIKGSCAK